MLWDLLQQLDLSDMRGRLDELQQAGGDTKKMAAAIAECELRLNVLVRLLIAKGLISAEEYAGVLTAGRGGDGDAIAEKTS